MRPSFLTTNNLAKRRLLPQIFAERILNSEMNQTVCAKCGTVLPAGTSFCRQCGQPAAETALSSEQTTAVLGTSPDAGTTKRLDPRPTATDYELNSESLTRASASRASASSWTRVVTVAIVVVVLALISVGVIWGLKGRNSANNFLVDRSLVYPGSRTLVDFGDRGGSVLQLETADAFEKVRDWYDANLKPTKTLRVTPSSVIQKKDNVTVTLVSENNVTSVVIKQVR